METATEYVDKAGNWMIYLMDLLKNWGPKVLLALGLLIVGIIIINRIVRVMRKVLKKRDVDPILIPFLCSMVNIGLKVLLIISVVDIVGVIQSDVVS